MKRVIEFPKPRATEEDLESKPPATSKKIFNIADWTPTYVAINVDQWPFYAA